MAAGALAAGALAAGAPAAGGDKSAPAPAPVQWEPFADPSEQAFSTEVPKDWQVVGGMFRRSPIAASPWLRMLSPDRRVYIVVGDPSITWFTAPLASGFPVRPRPGQEFRPYLPGTEFARDYVTRILPAACGDVAITGQQQRPDLLQTPLAAVHPFAQHDAGEVTFTCRLRGTDVRGMVVALTLTYPPAPWLGGSLWTVPLLAGFVAPADRYGDATKLTVHIVASWRQNPDWVRRQQAVIDAATSQVNAATAAMNQYSQQAIARSQDQMHAMMRQSEAFDRILTGSSPYADPSGTIHHLDNTRTQWFGPGGRTLGTTGASPGPGWQQLKEVAPQ